MVSPLFSYQLALLALVWLFVMLHVTWPKRGVTPPPASAQPEPLPPKRTRAHEPQPLEGLTHKPPCARCERDAAHPQAPLPVRPDSMPSTHRRPRQLATSRHFCPHAGCDYRGWRGLGTLRANGPPRGGPWRPCHCTAWQGDVLETPGTLFHGNQAAVELIVRILACVAEGVGIRAPARVCEVAPATVLHWRGEAAAQLRAFSAFFLCDLHLEQLQLDEWDAVLRARKAGEISEEAAIKRLERAPAWGWTALAPKRTWLGGGDGGSRTLARAPRVVQQVPQVVARDCVPLLLTDGRKDYGTAWLTHWGQWRHPARRPEKGPSPPPRWLPLPALLDAQVVQSYRRRRLVGVKHRVGFGTRLASAPSVAPWGWTSTTAFVERLNLDSRQRVAAIGRRGKTLCQGEEGLLEQMMLFQTSHNFVLPHASLRQPLPMAEAPHGRGSAQRWQPGTPAMAAGLPAHVWSLPEVLLYRGPPWPQPAGV